MSLFQKIKSVFVREEKNKEKSKEVKRDYFLCAFFPKKSLRDKFYKDEKGLVSLFKGGYFDSCAKDAEKTIKEIYGWGFEFKKIHGHESVDYCFSKKDISIKYNIKGTDGWQPAADGYTWSNDVRAFLQVEDPSLTSEKLNKLVTKMLEHQLIYK